MWLVKCSVQKQPRTCSMIKGVLKNFTKFTGKPLCWSLLLIKLQAFIKKRLWHRYFHLNFVKFLRTWFVQNRFGGCFCQNSNWASRSAKILNCKIWIIIYDDGLWSNRTQCLKRRMKSFVIFKVLLDRFQKMLEWRSPCLN